MCNLYENPSAPMCWEQYEDWFTVNLFGNCFDFLMRHPRMSMDIKKTDAHKLPQQIKKIELKSQNKEN